MSEFNILEKVRNDFKSAIERLSRLREKGEFQDYKTLCDVCQRLISMNLRNSNKEIVRDKENKFLYKKWDDVTTKFFSDALSMLEKEMKELSKILDMDSGKQYVRAYRELLIAFDKLNSIQLSIKNVASISH